MSEMKRLFCFSLLVILMLLSQSLPSSAKQGVLDPNLHHGRQMSPKPKDIFTSLELARKPRIYNRRKGILGIFGIAIRGSRVRRSSSAANGEQPAFLQVFLCFTLFLGVVLL